MLGELPLPFDTGRLMVDPISYAGPPLFSGSQNNGNKSYYQERNRIRLWHRHSTLKLSVDRV
jgi:hypothetical protein